MSFLSMADTVEEHFAEELVNAFLASYALYLVYYVIMIFAWAVLTLVVMWRLFARGGCHGISSLIPIYNVYCYYKIIYGKGWLMLLSLIPIVNVGLALVTPFFMAKAYGRNTFFFGLGLLFFPFIFSLVLAFGEDSYCGP